jgi:hypothetical protein
VRHCRPTEAPSRAAVAAAGLLALAVGFPPDAQARTRCSYAGPPANVMTVTVTGDSFGEIKRRGLEIAANESLEPPQPCSGGTPTVLNTDTISVLVNIYASVEVRLAGGPLAPGATPEMLGASEIEIQFGGKGDLNSVVGTPRSDEFHWGPGGANPGLNLNPRSAGDTDVDVTTRLEDGSIIADGAGGNDTIIGAPGALLRDGGFSEGGRGNDVLKAPPSSGLGSILGGGAGNDAITGGRLKDFIEGGAGNDRIAGGKGPDDITGGSGKDRLSGGAGRDSINSRDSRRDTVRCGPGRDRVKADAHDRVRGCERVSRR